MHRIKTFAAAALMVIAWAAPGIIKADVASSLAIASPDIKGLAPSFVAAQEASALQAAGVTSTVLHMRVTAYSSTPDQTDSTPFITASGMSVGDGIIASNILPFGTKVQIPQLFGKKVFTVEDRMSKRIKNTMDIWMATREKAIWFGVRVANIVVVSIPSPVRAAPLVAANGQFTI